nr:PilZ domain-containing protein [Polyangiaceae bacterium]
MEKVVAEFVSFVRQRAMPEPFVVAFEQIARQFLAAFPKVPPEHFGPEEVEAFLKRAAARGASEQQLKNARTATEALVWYLKHRSRPSLQPPPAATATRAEERVSFIRDVEVTDLGSCRSSDLSSRGIFIETLASLNVGNELELCFRLEHDDPPISVRARVVYAHPMGAGLAFREVPPHVQARIERYLAMTRGVG